MANEVALKQLVRNLAGALMSAIEVIVVADNPSLHVSTNGHTARPLALPTPSTSPAPNPAPKKKAAKKSSKKKASRPRQPPDDEDDEEDGDGEESGQTPKMTRAVSMGEVGDTIGRYLAKIGVGQSFDGNAIKGLFDSDVNPQTITNAMARWIDQGIIERTKSGNRFTPSTYRKTRAMEVED